MTSSDLAIDMLAVGPLSTNCFIVWDKDKKQGIVIDPGDDGDIIVQRVRELGIDILAVYATHGHFDHVAGSAPLKAEFDVEFIMHEGDLFFIEDAVESAARWGITIAEPSKPDRFIKGGDKVKVGDFELDVLYTPGHSPGGISFYRENMLFSGDCLFQGSIGRTDFRKGSLDELTKTIRTCLYTLPDDTIVYTGHGPTTTIGEEKLNNPFVKGC